MNNSNDEVAATGGDLGARMTNVESSLSNIEITLQRFLATQQENQLNPSTSQGDFSRDGRPNNPLQGGQGHSSEVPNFIPIFSNAPSQGTQAQGLPTITLPLQGLASANNDTLVFNPQQLLSQYSAPAISVMGGLPPVPGYIANMIQKNKYVDFALLRLCNLNILPTVEPTSTQLTRLLRTDLHPIESFVDWAEAWAVYAALVAKVAPEKLAPLISYFLVVAKAHRDIPGKGWMEYDKAFRKQAADNLSLSWSVMDPTLYLSTVLTRGAHSSASYTKSQGQAASTARKDQVCFNWNSGGCNFPRCKFRHVCSRCEGNHPRPSCEPKSQTRGEGIKRRASPPPEESKKYKPQ